MRHAARLGMIAILASSLGLAPVSMGAPRAPDRANRECAPEARRAAPLEVWVEPEAEQRPVVEAIAGARVSIRVMVYELRRGAVLEALVRRAKAGVKVRVILDGGKDQVNEEAFADLRAAGARVRWSDPSFSYMHAKTVVIDEAEALICTGNFGVIPRLPAARDFGVRDVDPDDVATLAALFDADWQGRRAKVGCSRLLIAPENARERLLALIEGAQRTLDIASMELGDAKVRRAIAARRRAGVRVRVILADPRWIAANADAAAFLGENGITARYLESPALHAKVISVDGERAYLGSVNLTRTSLEQNREVGVIADEAAVIGVIAETFARDFRRAKVF